MALLILNTILYIIAGILFLIFALGFGFRVIYRRLKNILAWGIGTILALVSFVGFGILIIILV